MKKIFFVSSIILLAFSSKILAQPIINQGANNISATSADLNWDANGCTEVRLQWEEVGAGWSPNINNPAMPYLLTGLNSYTEYRWRVKCQGTPWANIPVDTFTTLCGGPVGCTDVNACNYDATAICDDNSCDFSSCVGCMDPTATNYDATATIDDGSCLFPVLGCIDPLALNYYLLADTDDGSCVYVGPDIDTSYVSSPILCYDAYAVDSMQININQTGTPTSFVLQTGFYAPGNSTFFINYSGTNQTNVIQVGLQGFPPGDYFIRIVDSLSYYTANPFGNGTSSIGIYDEFGPVTFTEPDSLSATYVVTDVDCNGSATGEIDITMSGGTPGYTYSWVASNGGDLGVNSSNSEDLIGLTAGDYTCTVTDTNGCDDDYIFSIAEPAAPLTVTSAVSTSNFGGYNVQCNGDTTGTIDITVNDGTPGYTYSWVASNGGNLGVNSSANDDLISLIAGEYECTITDANGCQEVESVIITEPSAALSVTSSIIDVSCHGDTTGEIDILVTGGTPAYNYTWATNNGNLGANTNNVEDLVSLVAGDYTCLVIDVNGCQDWHIVSIAEPAAPLSAISAATDVDCNGFATGDIDITISGGTPGYTYSWVASNGGSLGVNSSTAEDLIGLISGDYQCTITDSNSCILGDTLITIAEPSLLTADLTIKTDITCNGFNDGTATVINPSGGTPSYTYLWDDPLNQTTASATGLSGGTYTCTITDANGCNFIANTVIIIDPLLITSDSTIKTDITCNGFNDGTATVINLSGGTPGYTYLWDDPSAQTTISATGLLAGTYTCTITDANGCDFIASSVTTIDPPALVIDGISLNPVTCYAECDASITSIQVSGGTPFTGPYSYLYSVNGGLPHPNMSYFNGYCAGTYTVEVTDLYCATSTYLIINEPTLLDVNITTSLWNNYQIKCYGDNSGSADILAVGGTAPYDISYYEVGTTPISTPSSIVSGLSAGIYTFEVVDDHGCDTSITITYHEPDPITHNFIPTHVTCNAWNNGSLIDSVYGGVGNSTTYNYAWNTGDITYSLTGITTGTYTMTVTDLNNCVSVDNYVINDLNALSASVSSSDVSCYNYCDGQIIVNANGGIPNINSFGDSIYNFQWNDTLLQTTDTAFGLCVDNNSLSTIYECVITDMQGCILTLSYAISQPVQLLVSASIDEEILCYGGSNGKLSSSPSGGSGTYTFEWNNNTNNQNNNGVSAGDYIITVTDSEGCTAADFITLDQPTELSLTVSDTSITCFGFNDGKIVAIAENGTPFLGIPPKYEYTLVNNQTGASIYSQTTATAVAENLMPGIYKIVAKDYNSCAIESGTIYISEPGDSLSITFNTVDASCLESNGSASVIVYGGTPSYQYKWDNNVMVVNNTNLEAGYYPITVIDNRGCEKRDSAFVKGTHSVFADSLSQITFNICLGDSVFIRINETPFNSYIWENGSTMTDRWVYPENYENVYTLTIIDPTCASSYEVLANVNVNFIDAMPESNPGIEYGNSPVVLAGDNIELYSANDTCVEYTWQWTNDTISNSTGSIIINNLQETDWYYLYVKDAEGCLGYDSIYVVVGVKPYEAITPNNDGFNDTWTPLDIHSYENALVQVFNRWGGIVFESKGGVYYQAWDGTNNGEELAVGTYYYIIDLNNGENPQTGPITIIR